MTNPPTPEDKITEILTQYRSNMFDYYTSDAWEDGIGYPMTWDDEARHALLALLNEARLDELKRAFIADGGHEQIVSDGKIVQYSSSIRFQAYYDDRIAQLRAATPKENV